MLMPEVLDYVDRYYFSYCVNQYWRVIQLGKNQILLHSLFEAGAMILPLLADRERNSFIIKLIDNKLGENE